MATGGQRTQSSSLSAKGSDFVFDFSCKPCEKEGRNIEAINFCINCSLYFCLACTKDHQTLKATSGHNVVNRTLAKTVGGAPRSSGILPNEVCRDHQDEKITTYCADHDLVLCNTCVHVDHRLCEGIFYIPNVASGSKHIDDITQVHQELFQSRTAVRQTKLFLQNLLTTADKEKKEHFKRFRDCTESLIKHARDLEKTAVDDVNDCHKTTSDILRSEIVSLDEAAMAMKISLKHIQNVKENSASQVSVDIKRGVYELKNARKLNQNLTSGKAKPEFVVLNDVTFFLNEVRRLGQYVEKKAYQVDLYGEYDVEMSEDTFESDITTSCELLDGTILIADLNNSCVKRLDKSYKITERFNMTSHPFGICQTGESEVAVTLTDAREIQFVNVKGKLNLSRSVNVHVLCRSIVCSRDTLFATCSGGRESKDSACENSGFVGVFSMAGVILSKIQLDHLGQQIFSMPYQITTSDNGNKIHIADLTDGIITIDRHGRVLSTSSKGIGASGVCAMPDDSLLVCCGLNNLVLQFSSDGEIVAKLLGGEDGIKQPRSLLFLRGSPRFVLTELETNKIKVFNLET